jgi:hypothetical protein
MSGAIVAATSGATAATVAAAAAARMRQEEENMTKYSAEDLDGWEFKIMRSAMGRFKNYQQLQQICQEEARAGWELVEKFDDHRVRFKRRTDRRSADRGLPIDPYRTNVGIQGGGLAAIIVGVTFVLTGLGILIAFAVQR